MKKIFIASVMLTIGLNSYADDEQLIAGSELPAEIKHYLHAHFPDLPILQATVDKELLSKSYEVILKGNINLEFDSDNQIEDLSGSGPLPDSAIPAPVLAYVKKHYPKNQITDWERDDNKQKIELDNDLELEFNAKGDFLKIDD